MEENDLIFINVIKGLVANTTFKVHVNGLFTRDVDLKRGVRQGDPLAPLPFYFDHPIFYAAFGVEEMQWRDPGLKITQDKELLMQMFANNTRIFFQNSEGNYCRIKEVISTYKKCSRAKPNKRKLEFFPLIFSPSLMDPRNGLQGTESRGSNQIFGVPDWAGYYTRIGARFPTREGT